MLKEPGKPFQAFNVCGCLRTFVVNKTIVVETTNDEEQGIECKPDCPCELEGNCANPCESLKCEIIKAKTGE